MGVDIHALHFLMYCKSLQDMRHTVMLGRQENHVPRSKLIEYGISSEDAENKYGEFIFTNLLSAKSIDSLDYSDYEGANILADLSGKLPSQLLHRFDTVFDGGVLEHIYDAPNALLNISKLLRKGGQIIHVVPANNFCGHGFWQFSPELFFSLYSEKNGYRNTEVFLAKLTDNNSWFRVIRPRSGKRTFSLSKEPLYIMVRTILKEEAFSHEDVQQSDYLHAWDSSGNFIEKPKVSKSKINSSIARLRRFFVPKHIRLRQERSLTRWNPWIEIVSVPPNNIDTLEPR